MIDDRDRSRLIDMLSYARDAIELLGESDAVALAASKLQRYAVTPAMEIVGEAASRVSQPGRAACPGISWSGAIGTRNRLIHHYRGLDLDVMISTVREDFPSLIEERERILGESAP
jgi:uncharacterized protein with HEPN domain